MSSFQLELPAGGRLELAYAAVKPGREDQLFARYFPEVGPIVAEYGGRPLGSFKLIEAPENLPNATFGALFYWPSVKAYNAFHLDPRFLDLKDLRDDALALLSNAHFFEISADLSVPIQVEETHRIDVTDRTPPNDALMSLDFAQDSPDQNFAEKSLVLRANDNNQTTPVETTPDTATFIFNPPAAA